MQIQDFRSRRVFAFFAFALMALTAGRANAVIMKLTPLAEVLETEDFIFVAQAEKIDPQRPSVIFKLEKNLKGTAPFERLPVNMTGTAEAKKNDDTKTILDRLDTSRKVVCFASKRGKEYNAMAFVEGSWFSMRGTIDDADKMVRWAFQNGEPFLRRTFKGTSPELIKVLEDGLAKKAKPPAPDEKEKPGYGPAVEKKCESTDEALPATRPGLSPIASTSNSRESNHTAVPFSRGIESSSTKELFAVIPSTVLIAPLAIIAALFPGVFARLSVGMKRWRAFLVIASLNSSLALVYFFIQHYLPSSWWFGTKAFTLYLMAITAIGLVWAGLRYRRFATQEPGITDTPKRIELYTLGGLTAFAAVSVCLTAAFASWGTNLEIPMREFTFIGIALTAAALYAAYRMFTSKADALTEGVSTDRRLSLSGETVGLGVLFLCGWSAVYQHGTTASFAGSNETGEADAIGPQLTSVRVFEIPKTSQVLSGIAIHDDKLYFGTQYIRTKEEGHVVCMDRETGEVKWKIGDDDQMLPVFCMPRVIDGNVYCGEGLHENSGCRMFCFRVSDGTAAWNKPIQTASHTEGSPAVSKGVLYFPAGDDGLFAADATTGTQLWQFPGGKQAGIHIDAPPAVSGNKVFIGSGLYNFVAICLDKGTGSELWRTD